MILLVLALSLSCARQTVPDIEACVKLTSNAFCKYTNSGLEKTVAVNNWADFHQDRISISIDDFSKIITFIEKSCLIHDDCDFEKISKMKSLIEVNSADLD